ncbi:hypothetical protein HPB51_015331 [Rhipicephalus microplus]|uniref:Sema domain-containing protein n=1 Tax=Rhipicephalus microplus TaxID=6941 RepID=A0A9J6DGT6_RHIMP|nr:hypothetical protein HPB51_015331 [Rhipicephalus microplus]
MEQRRNLGHLLAVTLLTLNLTNVLTSEAGIAIETFQTLVGPAQNILYLKLSQHEGVVIVSVRNALYALSPGGLSVRAVYRTGPENDSLMCPPYPLPCSHNRNLTDNISRILLQVGAEPLVLACGVTSQGMCSIHDPLQDLKLTSSMEKKVPDNYVASKRNTVAFFAKRNDGRNVLFAAAVSDGRPPQYRLFPLSARVLNSSGSFRLLSHAGAASVGFTNKPRASETLRFVYGFSHNGFAYFVEVRKVLVWSRYSFETRLVRVCENDEPSFRTYVDVPIICPRHSDGLSVATSAHLGPSMTASAGGSDSNASVLAVAFGKPSAIRAKYFALSLSLSAVCFFDMNHVENAFRETIENCNKGLSSARLSLLYHDDGHDLMCSHQETEGQDICGPSRNQYVEGMIPLAGRATITLTRRLATSVAVMKQNGSAVVWIGDSQGILHKYLLQGEAPRPLAALDVSHIGREISRNFALDSDGTYGYFLIGNEVVSFTAVAPNYGPVAGGTNVSLNGVNLDIGLERVVKIGRSLCRIRRVENKFLHCSTGSVSPRSLQKMQVRLFIDGTEVPFSTADSRRPTFTYMPNPVIEHISPSNATFSQNFSVEVVGSHLDSVAQPLIVTQGTFLNQKQKGYIRKECHVVEGGSKMLCPGTALTDSSVIAPGGLKAFNGSVPVRISFQMDGLHLPLAPNGGNGHFTLTYQPKPQFKKFPQSQRSIDPSQPVIEIQGNYFELFMGHEPVFVRVNGFDDACNVTNDFSKGNHSVLRIVAKRGDHHPLLSRVRLRGVVFCWMTCPVDESLGGVMSVFVPREPRVARSPDDLNAATT